MEIIALAALAISAIFLTGVIAGLAVSPAFEITLRLPLVIKRKRNDV